MYWLILIKINKRWRPVFKSEPKKLLNRVMRYWLGGVECMPCIFNSYQIACAEMKKVKKEFNEGISIAKDKLLKVQKVDIIFVKKKIKGRTFKVKKK